MGKKDKNYRISRKFIYNFLIAVLLISIAVLGYVLLGNAKDKPIENSKALSPTVSAATTVTASNTANPSKTVSPQEYERRRSEILLVNLDHRLKSDYVPSNLVNLRDNLTVDSVSSRNADTKIDSVTLTAANQMFQAAGNDGVSGCIITTAYRTYQFQQTLYEQQDEPVNKEGYYTVFPPVASEHLTGMAIDITNTDLENSNNKLTDEFGKTEQGIWLGEHCWEYGFIIRYPIAKSYITKTVFEPWHLRYVGKEHSMAMKASGECLEEYLGYVKK